LPIFAFVSCAFGVITLFQLFPCFLLGVSLFQVLTFKSLYQFQLTYVEVHSFHTIVNSFFNHRRMLDIVKCFFYINEITVGFLSFILLMWYITCIDLHMLSNILPKVL
jgi:hypothetical protein